MTRDQKIRAALQGQKGTNPYAESAPSRSASRQGQHHPEFGDRVKRVRQSLDRINDLMQEHKKLQRDKNKETEKSEHHISEHELYTPCPHCGTPEFKKTESGPKYTPCACFYVTLRTEEGKATTFVRVTKKSEGGYSLTFNQDADKESVQTFLLTLKNRLLKHKDSL